VCDAFEPLARCQKSPAFAASRVRLLSNCRRPVMAGRPPAPVVGLRGWPVSVIVMSYWCNRFLMQRRDSANFRRRRLYTSLSCHTVLSALSQHRVGLTGSVSLRSRSSHWEHETPSAVVRGPDCLRLKRTGQTSISFRPLKRAQI